MAAVIWQKTTRHCMAECCVCEGHATFHSHRPAIPGTALALFLSSGSHRHHVRAPTLSGCCCCCPGVPALPSLPPPLSLSMLLPQAGDAGGENVGEETGVNCLPTPSAPPSPVLTTFAAAAAAAAVNFEAAACRGDEGLGGKGGGSSSGERRCGASTYTSSAVFLSFLQSWRVLWLNIWWAWGERRNKHASQTRRTQLSTWCLKPCVVPRKPRRSLPARVYTSSIEPT